MQMLKNIFNSEKKYFLELNDKDVPQPVKQAVKTAEKVADTIQNQAEKAADIVQDQVETVAESEPKAAQNGKQAVKTAAEKPKATPQNAKKTAPKSEPAPKPTPQNAGASSFEPPFWVAAMYKNSNSEVNSDGTPVEQTFATDNLMPVVSKYRRTPGPSLDKFKDMARKTKGFRG